MSADEQLLVRAAEDLRRGRILQAEDSVRSVLARQPRHFKAMDFMAGIEMSRGQIGAAADWLRRAIAVAPSNWELHYNLGVVLAAARRNPEAIAAYQEAVRLRPDLPAPHNNLGNIFQAEGQLSEALAHFEQAIKAQPDYVLAHNNIGLAKLSQGKIDEALVSLRRALELQPKYAAAHSNILLALNSREGIDRDSMLREHRAFGVQHADPLRAKRPPMRAIAPNDRLRIGYVSADFRSHSVAFFLDKILIHHNRTRFAITCYSNVSRPDAMTERMRSTVESWRDIVGLNDDQAAELVRRDGIDILVDLGGHTEKNRLLLLARRPAPVQVSYLGYPNTTGLSQIDYLVSDRYIIPPGDERFYAERIVRVPGNFFCYFGPELNIPVAPPPMVKKGYVTFAVLTNWVKVRPVMMEQWAEILRQVPNSRLLLKASSLRDPQLAREVKAWFSERGISGTRIETQGWTDFLSYMRLMGEIDIGLDTFPFNGHTTTCHQLWMGVPVVSLTGQTHSSRLGLSVLEGLGLGELVATTEKQYLEIATRLATDAGKLSYWRTEMRERWERSGLLDGARFARNLEEIYTGIWQEAGRALQR